MNLRQHTDTAGEKERENDLRQVILSFVDCGALSPLIPYEDWNFCRYEADRALSYELFKVGILHFQSGLPAQFR